MVGTEDLIKRIIRVLTINSGFNLRPLDLTASIGLSQLKKLNKFKSQRSQNRKSIINGLRLSKKWQNQFTFIKLLIV